MSPIFHSGYACQVVFSIAAYPAEESLFPLRYQIHNENPDL